MSSTYNPLAWQRQGQLHDSGCDTKAVSGPDRSRAEGLADSLCTSTVTRPVSAQHPAQPLQGPSSRKLTFYNGVTGAGRQEGLLSSILQFPPAATGPSAPPGFAAVPPLQLPAAIPRTTTPSYLPPHLRARPPQRLEAAHAPQQAQPAAPSVPTAAVPYLNLPAHLQLPRQQPMTSSVLHAAQQSQLQNLLSLLGSARAADDLTPAAPSGSNADQPTVAAAATTAAPPGFDLPSLRLGSSAPDPAPVAEELDPAPAASAAATPRSSKPPPPGFGTSASASAVAAAPTAVIQQCEQPGATAATALGPTASAAAAADEGTVPTILALHSSQPAAAAAAAVPSALTAAAGSSSAAAPQVLAPTWAAAVSSTPAVAVTGAPATLPPPQPQPQQRYGPRQPRPTLSVMLDRLNRELHSSPGSGGVNFPVSGVRFSLKEGLKWLQGYDPTARRLVDDHMRAYLELIRKDQGPAVLSCVVFFGMGHHGVFRGDLPMLTLDSADHPAKVLNKRVSYYKALFSQSNNKAELLAALVAHRPDTASHLKHRVVERLFNSSTDTAAAAAVVAGLLLLPEGWEEVCADPDQYVNRYVVAVLQDTSNADKMVAHLDRKVQAAAPAPAAADDDDDRESSISSNGDAAAAVQEAAPDAGQQQQQPATRTAWSRSSSASSSTADISRAAAAAVTAAQQQPPVRSAWRGAAAADTLSAGNQQRQQQLPEQSSSNPSSRHPSPGEAKTAAAAAGDRSQMTTAADISGRPGSSSSSNKSDLVELALKQLQVDRPDVMMFTTRDLRDRIKTLDSAAAVAAVGELMKLPKGWEARFAKVGTPQPTEHLSSIVSRAAAHAAAAGSSGSSSTADGHGWVTLDQRTKAQVNASSNGDAIVRSTDNNSSTIAMRSSSSDGFSKGTNVSAAWRKLEADKPWLMKYLKDKHRTEVRSEYGEALTASQQLQVLSVLSCVNPGTVINAKESDATLMNIIRKAKAAVLQPTPKPLQDALDALSLSHPHIMPYVDAGMFSTLHNLAVRDASKAVAAVRELRSMNFPKDFERKYKNPSGFMMAIITKHVK